MERTIGSRWQLVSTIDGMPTMANTIHHLNRVCPKNAHALLREMEIEEAAIEASEAAGTRDLLAEGSDRVYSELGDQHTVSFHGVPSTSKRGRPSS